MTAPNDFYPTLRRAIALAREAGLCDAADALESRAFAAFTTGSEALGETGLAILEFRARAGQRLPTEVARLLDACQTEIGKVWPRLRPGWQGVRCCADWRGGGSADGRQGPKRRRCRNRWSTCASERGRAAADEAAVRGGTDPRGVQRYPAGRPGGSVGFDQGLKRRRVGAACQSDVGIEWPGRVVPAGQRPGVQRRVQTVQVGCANAASVMPRTPNTRVRCGAIRLACGSCAARPASMRARIASGQSGKAIT